jgi:FtsP/CotA-like multicopper oxidase with cupredoxin domain
MSLRTAGRLALVASLVVGGAAPQTGARLACADRVGAAANVSPHCVDLLPTPDLPGASAVLELRPAPSVFGVATTVGGAVRHDLVIHARGLPAPASLGAYRVYVAWAASVTMDSVVRLGVVRNGRTRLGELSRDQYRVIVSAEADSTASTRRGRLVLRGSSPATRLLAHRDMMQPVSPGLPRDMSPTSPPAGTASHAQHGMSTGTASWTMPPVPEWMRPMPMAHPAPSVGALRVGAGIDVMRLPAVAPMRVAELRDGDTLRLEASMVRRDIAGRPTVTYAFNGQHPGPLLRVAQGATIVVDFVNRIDMPTAVHWHGVRLENRSDGAIGVTQRAVNPGERYLYRVHFRDAGVYWYHPHHREDVQQDLGLVGNMLVAPRAAGYWNRVDDERVLLLDDLLVAGDGVFPYGAEAPTHALMGRFGNLFLVNGEPGYRMRVERGRTIRFYLTNAASARFFNVSFGSTSVKVVGTDLGKFERETWARSVVIAPAERYVVEARFDSAGPVALTNRIRALDHMAGWFVDRVDTLAVIDVVDAPARSPGPEFTRLRDNADVGAEVAPLRRRLSAAPDRSIALQMRLGQVPAGVSAMLWGSPVTVDWNDGMPMLNWMLTARDVTWVIRDRATGRENMDVAWRFRRGALVKLRIFNDPLAAHAMAHPMHVHGQRFVVLSRNGVANDNLAWKDTAIIPVGETVDLLVEMSNPGRWMLHCHIAEHLGAGMMMVFVVE